MRIAMTGHTAGIGQAIFETYLDRIKDDESYRQVYGFSRSNGYDLSEDATVSKIIDFIVQEDIDVFINNAYHSYNQTRLFQLLYQLWRVVPDKTIVNINSRTVYGTSDNDYSGSKKNFQEHTQAAINDYHRQCRIITAYPGYVRTQFLGKELLSSNLNMLTPKEAADIICWSIDQPQHIEIGELAFWCTVTNP